jgi:dipeptidase
MPVEVGIVIWLAQHRPDSQALIPWYLGIEKMPDGYAYGDFKSALEKHFSPPGNIHEKNDNHAFWAFVSLAEYVDQDYGDRILKVRKTWDPIEKKIFKNQQSFENEVIKIYKNDPVKARKLLTAYTNDWAAKIWDMARELSR